MTAAIKVTAEGCGATFDPDDGGRLRRSESAMGVEKFWSIRPPGGDCFSS